jgi:hypothetical protein
MDVDPYQWPSDDQIPTWSIFHQDNRPRPSFNGVSHSGEPAASYPNSTVPAQLTAPPIQLPSTVAHNNIPHGDYVETDVVMFEDDYVEPPPVMTGYPYVAHWEYLEGPELRTNAVPVIIGYAPEYREDMEIDTEGPPIEFQPINHYPPHFGGEAILVILLFSMVMSSTIFLTTPMNHISMRAHKSFHLRLWLMME